MPITKDSNGQIQYTPPIRAREFDETHVTRDADFAIADHDNVLKQIKFDVNPTSTGPGVLTIQADVSADATINLNNLSISNTFSTIQPDSGTSPTASSPTDTLTLHSSSSTLSVSGNAGTKTITFGLSGGDLTSSTSGINIVGGTGAIIGSGVALDIQTASGSQPGLLSASDWTTFNTKQSAITTGNLTSGTTGVSVTGGTGAVLGAGATISVQTASGSQPGLLSSADWTTFNNKQSTLTTGNLTTSTAGISITGGTGAVLGAGSTVNVQTASSSQPGLLSSVDWTTFNGKQSAGNYITGLTGDVTASGPGSAAATISNLAVTNAKIANATIDLTTKVTGVLPNGNTTATSANTASTIVARDASGNFTAGTITASVVAPTSSVATVSASTYAVASGVTNVYVDLTSNDVTITLPNPATSPRTITIYDILGLNGGSFNLFVAPFGSEKISGIAATRQLYGAWNTWTLSTNQTNWFLR